MTITKEQLQEFIEREGSAALSPLLLRAVEALQFYQNEVPHLYRLGKKGGDVFFLASEPIDESPLYLKDYPAKEALSQIEATIKGGE